MLDRCDERPFTLRRGFRVGTFRKIREALRRTENGKHISENRVDQPACKPGSVGPVSRLTDVAAIPLGRPLPAASSNQPGRRAWRAGLPSPRGKGVSPLFGFAPGGVCRAVRVAASAVRSYRTLSP